MRHVHCPRSFPIPHSAIGWAMVIGAFRNGTECLVRQTHVPTGESKCVDIWMTESRKGRMNRNFQKCSSNSRDKDGCTPNIRVPMVSIVFNLGILGDYNP